MKKHCAKEIRMLRGCKAHSQSNTWYCVNHNGKIEMNDFLVVIVNLLVELS